MDVERLDPLPLGRLGAAFITLAQGTLWRTYADANPVEAAKIIDYIAKKIDLKAYMLPTAQTKTGQVLILFIREFPSGGGVRP